MDPVPTELAVECSVPAATKHQILQEVLCGVWSDGEMSIGSMGDLSQVSFRSDGTGVYEVVRYRDSTLNFFHWCLDDKGSLVIKRSAHDGFEPIAGTASTKGRPVALQARVAPGETALERKTEILSINFQGDFRLPHGTFARVGDAHDASALRSLSVPGSQPWIYRSGKALAFDFQMNPLIFGAIGDAVGFCREESQATLNDPARPVEDLRYERNPRHDNPRPGSYSDDTEMMLAIADLASSDKPWTNETVAESLVRTYHAGGRRVGYSKEMARVLSRSNSGAEFLATVNSNRTSNGAAVRAPVIGLFPDIQDVQERAELQAAVTHNTVIGQDAAIASALMTHYMAYNLGTVEDLPKFLNDRVPGYGFDQVWSGKVSPEVGTDTIRAAVTAIVLGFRGGLTEILWRCMQFGGDVDSVACVALAAASCRPAQISRELPSHLIEGFEAGELGMEHLRRVGSRLASRVYPPAPTASLILPRIGTELAPFIPRDTAAFTVDDLEAVIQGRDIPGLFRAFDEIDSMPPLITRLWASEEKDLLVVGLRILHLLRRGFEDDQLGNLLCLAQCCRYESDEAREILERAASIAMGHSQPQPATDPRAFVHREALRLVGKICREHRLTIDDSLLGVVERDMRDATFCIAAWSVFFAVRRSEAITRIPVVFETLARADVPDSFLMFSIVEATSGDEQVGIVEALGGVPVIGGDLQERFRDYVRRHQELH